MSEPFDPYRKWLGIPPKDQPPNHYRLLGIAHFEDDPDVIENAATRQLAHVRTFQSGKHSALSQKILNELTTAKLCLLQPSKRVAYDEQLRAKLAAEGKLSSENFLVPSELIGESTDEDEPPRYEPADIKGMSDARWKTETEDMPPVEPPIVPIPMPRGTAVAVPSRLAPSLPLATAPLISSSRSGYRPRKPSSAAIPLAIAIIGLFIIVMGGIAVLVYSGAFSKPADRHPGKKNISPTTSVPLGVPTKENEPRDRPKGETVSRPSKASPASESLVKPVGSTVKQKPKPAKPSAERGTIEDQLRQALYVGRERLAIRQSDDCQTQLMMAEKLLEANPNADAQLKEDVHVLRELFDLNARFWSRVREAAINGRLQSGEKFVFRKAEFELVSHAGEMVSYKIGDQSHTAPLAEMDPRMALAVVFQSTQDDPSARLTMVAFAAIDRHGGKEYGHRDWAKNLYTQLALKGHTHAGLAKELGVAEKPDPTASVPELD